MSIDQTFVRIETDPASLSQICEELANLFNDEAAEVFVPYLPVPLNARVALPQPSELLVRFEDKNGIQTFIEAFRDRELSGRQGIQLTILNTENRHTTDVDSALEELESMVLSGIE